MAKSFKDAMRGLQSRFGLWLCGRGHHADAVSREVPAEMWAPTRVKLLADAGVITEVQTFTTSCPRCGCDLGMYSAFAFADLTVTP